MYYNEHFLYILCESQIAEIEIIIQICLFFSLRVDILRQVQVFFMLNLTI